MVIDVTASYVPAQDAEIIRMYPMYTFFSFARRADGCWLMAPRCVWLIWWWHR